MAENSGGDSLEDAELSSINNLTVHRSSSGSSDTLQSASMLPWQRGQLAATSTQFDLPLLKSVEEINPGEYVLQTLFSEFTHLAEKKIDRLMKESFERPLSKSLQRGEDPQFDQLLSSLSSVAEHCLSSLLKTLFMWYERQSRADDGGQKSPSRIKSGSESPRPGSRASFREKDFLWERRDLAVEFIFCLVLIEVLKQLSVHPVDDSLIQYIENLAFKHFKENLPNTTSPVTANQTIITALYAEVIGVLAQTRFQSIRKRFMQEYKENVGNTQVLLNIIVGLKYIRIKLYPVDEVEESFLFLQECAGLFYEKSTDKDKVKVKYAFASLFVEILIPVAATAKREYSIPAVKKFVDLLYKEVFDMSKKAKHSMAMYPLVTALLCISQKQFFLTNWGGFLNMCLNSIKSRDVKMQRMAMECLYRLLWVYIIRIKCESHSLTSNRLRSIVDTLFPKNSRSIIPRNIPLTIFVKIIQFIAQEKLDFAMQDIIFDLLNVGKSVRQLNPERMNIGLRAFLVIADNLQRKEGSPPMPSTIGQLPSGNTLKVKKTFTKLTEEAARNIGVVTYYTSVRRALDNILKTLDTQVGKSMTLINPQMVNKEANDMITGERKSKIDLFRTCVAAIPKCIPDGMSKNELVELVSRLTLHVDEELRNLAFAALQGLIVDFPEYRKDIVDGYIDFSLKEVQDVFPNIIENAIRMLAQMLIQWRNAVVQPVAPVTDKYLEMSMHCSKTADNKEVHSVHTLHAVEGFALAMLCSIKAMHRKLALTLLKELRLLYKTLYPDGKEERAIDVIEDNAALVIERALVYVSGSDKSSLGLSPQMDLYLLAEKSALLAEKQKDNISNCISRDLWSHCLAGFLDKIFSHVRHCSCSFQFTWPHINNRLFTIYSLIDPSADFDSIKSRTIISFKAPRTQANISDLCLWRNYLIFLCCTPPTSVLSPQTNTLLPVVNDAEIKTEVNKLSPDFPRLSDVFRIAIMLIRSESYEIREAAVTGLGKTNALAHSQLIEELQPLMREVLDRKAEGVRKKRKRDLLRLQVARIFAANAEQGCFRHSLAQADNNNILVCLGEYIEGMRTILESENEKEDAALMQLRLYFSKFLHKMIKSIPTVMQGTLLRNQGRHHLFLLLASWCGHFNVNSMGTSTKSGHHSVELELSALEAMCALLCCGQVFDQKALTVSNGYLYKLLDTMLVSTNVKVNKLGQETVELLLENNESIPALLNFVVDRCYTGDRGISNGCFLALANVFSKRPYACQLIPLLCVVLFKTGDPSPEIREKAAQLICILDRRFFGYMVPFRSATAAYAYGNQAFSMQLAFTHPELTLALLSEMTLRFESATMVGQRCLLQYLVPWLKNVELVDISEGNTPNAAEFELDDYNIPENSRQLKPVSLHGEGWGSVMASQLVLNNLFYLTAKYEEYYSKEIEECWSALCSRWERNVSHILDYLIVMAGLCGTTVLIHAKKVAVFIARAKTEMAIIELTEELKLTDIVTNFWDRLDSPPYFKNLNKCQSPPTNRSASEEVSPIKHVAADSETDNRSESPALGLNSRTSVERSSCGSAKAFAETVLESAKASQKAEQIEQKKNETGSSELWMLQWAIKAQQMQGVGLPLPMPYELLYFAPIIQVFPVTTPPAQLYRCNFSLMLLAEIVSDRRDISWIQYLPLLLHVSFLGLDHAKPLVHENCKRLIINLLVVLVCDGDRSTIAKALMDFQTVSCTALNRTASVRSTTVNNDDGGNSEEDSLGKEEEGNLIAQADVDGPELEERGLSIDERAREVIEYLAKSDCKPLWAFEDITPRNGTIKSADQLESFLQIIMSLFDDALPHALLPGRWGREALHWATSCSSRHYAGRSFQIFRSLKVPLSWPMLSDILQRLVESVADNSDDVQGYFMEILMTFLSEVDYAFKERPKSVLEKVIVDEAATKRSGSLQDIHNEGDMEVEQQVYDLNFSDNQHMRSQSIDIDLRGHRMRSSSDGKKKDRRRYGSEMTLPSQSSNPPSLPSASTSAKDLTDLQQPESPYDMLARLFWIGVSLLESDYEHEFLLAIKLLDKILHTLNLRTSAGIDRVERVLNKLNWNNFPGVQSLLLKGLTSSGTAEQTLGLLSQLTILTSVTVIDPTPSSGLSMNVIAILPRLILGFEEPDEFCKKAATNILQACGSNGNLHDLGLIFTMYRDKEYSKSVQTWIEVVCKNIIDAFPQLSAQLLALLVEILEQGPHTFQQAVLNIICAILKYSDASAPGLKQFHGHLLRIITSHVKDVNLWKDSLNILKLVVSNASHIHQITSSNVGITSSQLVQPRGSIGSLLTLAPKLPWGSSLTLGDSSWSLTSQMFKKELPGKTLEFSYNVANTPVIGAKYSHDGKDEYENGTSSASAPCWRKPHSSQRRTRERLVQLLPLCGHKGGLKQSLSVIFSSSSELEGERALSSEDTSGDEQSGEKGEGEFSGQQLTKIFTDFDFLDDELDKDVEIGSFGWTSTTELHDEEFVENGHISPCGSESDQVTSTKDDDASADISADEDDPDSLQRSLTESSLRSLKEEESDIVDSPPSLPLDTTDAKPPTPRPSSPENDPETPNKRPATPSSPITVPKSSKSKLNTDETAGTSTPTSQSSFDSSSGLESVSTAVTQFQHQPDFAVLSYDEIPDRWTKLMSSFISHPSVEEAIDSLPCFPLVLKSWSIWLLRLTREASQILINYPISDISGVLSKLGTIEESLENELRLPYIFVDRAVFSTGKLLLKHRLTVLKLNVGLQGLHEKKEQAQEHLDLIQATKHEFSSEEELSELFDVGKTKQDDQTVMDFCTCLYRLHMQYVMCLEIYLAYVEKIVSAVQISSQITDVTVDLVSIRSELMASQKSTNNHDDSSPGPVISFRETADLVSDAVANRHFDEAITTLRAYRQRHPSLSTYEIRPDEEIETILSVYARSILKSRSGVFALLGSYEQLSVTCDKLSELLADYLTVIYDRNKNRKPMEESDNVEVKTERDSSPLSEETV
ncbi:protein furry homolog-like [Hydractinia symbiolongicarpus]|uniref:protein furry homolog-like n=1 Tax=Hydractinia symbiolongicarpus TaxID=13093 RepID=UPI00254A9FF1|nr:protein furry homolog-like [Hydractinia symbiolongicarpus]